MNMGSVDPFAQFHYKDILPFRTKLAVTNVATGKEPVWNQDFVLDDLASYMYDEFRIVVYD